MEDTASKQEEIRQRAERLIYSTEQLIDILDNWMPSEQANANMEREIMERYRRLQALDAVSDKPATSTADSRWKRLLKQLKNRQSCLPPDCRRQDRQA